VFTFPVASADRGRLQFLFFLGDELGPAPPPLSCAGADTSRSSIRFRRSFVGNLVRPAVLRARLRLRFQLRRGSCRVIFFLPGWPAGRSRRAAAPSPHSATTRTVAAEGAPTVRVEGSLSGEESRASNGPSSLRHRTRPRSRRLRKRPHRPTWLRENLSDLADAFPLAGLSTPM